MTNMKYIDLSKYGGNGQVVICGDVSLRSEAITKNEVSRRMVKVRVDGEETDAQYEEHIDAGDLEIIMVLKYVRKAPFSQTYDSFMKYCDTLEEVTPGASLKLFEEMQDAVQEVLGQPSPLES